LRDDEDDARNGSDILEKDGNKGREERSKGHTPRESLKRRSREVVITFRGQGVKVLNLQCGFFGVSNSERRQIGQVQRKEADKRRCSQVWSYRMVRDEKWVVGKRRDWDKMTKIRKRMGCLDDVSTWYRDTVYCTAVQY